DEIPPLAAGARPPRARGAMAPCRRAVAAPLLRSDARACRRRHAHRPPSPAERGLNVQPAATLVTLDSDDFTRLYRRNAQTLVLFFQRRVHDPELAIDLMSETFTTAIDRQEQFRGSSETELSGWLWAIARSTLRDHERRDATERAGASRLGVERR